MQIYLIDQNSDRAAELTDLIGSAEPGADIWVAKKTNSLFEKCRTDHPDMVFIHTDCDFDVIKTAAQLKKQLPHSGIVLLADNDDLALDAFHIHIQGYLVKPFTAERIAHECSFYKANNTSQGNLQSVQTAKNNLRITAFGNFEIYENGQVLYPYRSKTKELIAYLIDRRGTLVGDAELLNVLWGKSDKSTKSYLRTLKAEAIKLFADAGYLDAIIKKRGFIGIQAEAVNCDYYKALSVVPPDLSGYHGEYMSQYKWSKNTKRLLDCAVNESII